MTSSLQNRVRCVDIEDMLALSVRQPYAELIPFDSAQGRLCRGIKTAELRPRGTTVGGRRFYLC